MDTAQFNGLRRDYIVTKGITGEIGFTGTGAAAAFGGDLTRNVELFRFDGATLSREAFTPSSFNGDLKSDVLFASQTTGQVAAFLQTDLSLMSGVLIGPANGSSWTAAATGDLDGDGHSDIVWRHDSGQIVAYLMEGSVIRSAVVVGEASSSFKVAGVGDLTAMACRHRASPTARGRPWHG